MTILFAHNGPYGCMSIDTVAASDVIASSCAVLRPCYVVLVAPCPIDDDDTLLSFPPTTVHWY